MLFDVFYLVNIYCLFFDFIKIVFYHSAELDTIYRRKNQDEEEDEDNTDIKQESNKINEYLTYNW